MKINGEFRILLYFVAIFLLSTQLGLVNGDGKCFKEDRFDLPIVPSKSDKIYLLETQRSAHKAANAIYKIILEEILNYTNVEIVNMTNKIEQTTMLRHLSRSKQYNKPSLQISTALWNNPDEPIISDIALSAGALTEPGKYGLFYATQFGPIEFSMLQSPTEKDLKKFTLAEDVSPINITDVDGRCANRTCIPVLGSDIDKEQNIQNLIKYENLSIQVLWLSNLTEVVDHLIKTNQPFIVLHWTPSEITMNFSSINLPSNKYYRFETTTIGKYYRYYAYPNPEPFKVATKALQFLKISKLDFFDLFQNPANSTYSITCEIAKRCVKTMSSDLKRYLPQSKVIFTIGSIYPEDGTKLKDIFEKTVNVINNHSNPDFSIELQSKNGNCQADQVLRHTIEYFNAGIVDGILGPACSETIQPIAGISRYLNIPIISYAAEAPEFDQDKYPYFFRTIGSNGQYGDVYIQFFKMFDWKRFATITEEGKKSTEYIINMEKKSKTDSIESIMDIKMTKQTNTSDIIDHLQELKRRRVRVIIAHVRNELIEVVLCEAYHLKMTAQYNYVWFLPPNPSTKSSRCTSEEINLALNGHFSLIHKPFNKTSIYIENFMTNKSLCELPDRKYMAGCNYFGFAFDAILAYFQAATKLVAESPRAFESSDYRNITRFTELIRDSDFEGVTGRVRFGKGNSRITNITILQWSEDQYNVVGEYQPNITGYKENMSTETGTIYVNQSAIKWAGIPSDGTFDCKLSMLVKMFGTDCENENVTLEILIIVFVFALICAGLFWFVKRRYDNKLRESAKVMKNFGIDLLAPTTATYNTLDKWEVPKESIVINRRLGEGEFGTVFGGEAKFPHYDEWIAVAVKSLKCGATNESKLDFLSEAEAMKRFNHEHIVKLLGVSLQTEPVYTIMEYMLYGDLKTFLLARRHMIHEKINDDSDISPKRLTKYALGIAKALKYLSDNKFVHRDVACRNVLLSADRVAKLGDFGMARSMYENDYYRFNRKGLLPVRWMAPESLALSVFTPASDIWSFGVFLYEIITFGSFPYQGLTNRQALQCIVSKQILTIPSDVKPQLEKLIKACWNQDAKYRPRASDIISLMEQLPLLVSPCLDVPISSVELHENNEPINIDLLAKMGFKKLKSPVIAQMSTINNLDYTNTDANGMIIPMESMNVYPIEEEEDDVVTELIPKSVASSSPSSSSSTSSSSYASSSSSTANNSEAASELYTIETNNDYCSMVPLLNNNNSHDSNHNSTHILDKPSNATITQFSRLNDVEHGH